MPHCISVASTQKPSKPSTLPPEMQSKLQTPASWGTDPWIKRMEAAKQKTREKWQRWLADFQGNRRQVNSCPVAFVTDSSCCNVRCPFPPSTFQTSPDARAPLLFQCIAGEKAVKHLALGVEAGASGCQMSIFLQDWQLVIIGTEFFCAFVCVQGRQQSFPFDIQQMVFSPRWMMAGSRALVWIGGFGVSSTLGECTVEAARRRTTTRCGCLPLDGFVK